MFSHSQMRVLILAAPAEPDDIWASSSSPTISWSIVDGPRHTPNKFDNKRTDIWCQRAIHNKFRQTAFSRSVQTPLVRPGLDAVVGLHVSNHIPLTTVSHCHDWRSWKLRLLQLYLSKKQAWKGNPKKLCVSINKWCHPNKYMYL